MKTGTFSNSSNARRAAREAIAAGEALSADFAIEQIGAKCARDARYVIVWAELAKPGGAASAPVTTAKLAHGRKRQPASGRGAAAARAASPRQSKNTELDVAAAAGVMPEKPIVTSRANIRGQKRFDYLAERAAVGDWATIKAYVINSNNTQAKQLNR